jgi:phage shock protein A
MLKDLGALLHRALDRFKAEAGRRDPEDQIAELLGGMRREMVDARALVSELKQAAAGAQSELAREQQRLADCLRRRDLAAKIGDEETTRVAEEFESRHREAVGVLEAKARATEAELQLRTREADELAERYRQADARRFALLAELRQAGAHGRAEREMAGLEGDFDRFAEQIDDHARRTEATGEVERKLEELKRRAGSEPR